MDKQSNAGLVSIIVPVYNVENYIIETLQSVEAQTYPHWELLLVDDGSEDGTLQRIAEYMESRPDARIRLLSQETNGGAAAARNRGLAEAQGRYIAYLDADDLWDADKLRKELEFMQRNDAGFAFTGYEFADEEGRGTGRIVHVPATLVYKQALKNTTIFTTTVMFDTEKIPKELLEMPLIKSEDTALWWKVLRHGYVAYGLDENLVKYRRAGHTLSSNKLEAVRRIWALYREAEGLGIAKSLWNFCFWAVRAVKRRI